MSSSQAKRYTPKPEWLKVPLPGGERYAAIRKIVEEKKLATVCQEARCPNMGECWGGGTATFMLMGDTCTRGCKFCHVSTGRPKGLDAQEPASIVYACREMGLDYLVLTSVNRDDLPDGGAAHLAETIRLLRRDLPKVLVEILIPDFQGDLRSLETVLAAKPHVLAHNVETVERLQKRVRDPRAAYDQSLAVLAHVKTFDPTIYTKPSIMVGVGETAEEIMKTFWDLRKNGVDIVTLGQYLQPSPRHLPVERYVTPEEFEEFKRWGEKVGFAFVASGPLVRSSYRAGELFLKSRLTS